MCQVVRILSYKTHSEVRVTIHSHCHHKNLDTYKYNHNDKNSICSSRLTLFWHYSGKPLVKIYFCLDEGDCAHTDGSVWQPDRHQVLGDHCWWTRYCHRWNFHGRIRFAGYNLLYALTMHTLFLTWRRDHIYTTTTI